MSNVVLSLERIVKHYPGVVALDNFSIEFEQGEVHALLGENGAGKSTLIKIIAGAIVPDGGTICLGDHTFNQLTPALAKEHGVEVIYQEFNLVGTLSAAENICLGERYGKLVDYKTMEQKAKEIFAEFNVDIDPATPVDQLSTAQQQIVEVAKAVSRNARILIMDEPSASLTVTEVEYMFNIVEKLKKRGVTVIYISHIIDEIFRISDRVTVMRDGSFVTTKRTDETSRPELISLMVGRDLKETYPTKADASKEVALEVRNLTGNGARDISFSVRKGEILGLAGLVGAGRTEIAQVIFGAARKEGGEILINGTPVELRSPQDAIRKGVGLIPEDRKRYGCFLDQTIRWNISFAKIKQISRNLVVDRSQEIKTAEEYKQMLDIKSPSLEVDVRTLSGGNQQKVVLAKTLAVDSQIIIFDEPTRGIDVGAKQEIYNLMCELAGRGIAIVMISSDMEELLGMADRIIVLAEGQVTGEVLKKDFSQDRILDLASTTNERRI